MIESADANDKLASLVAQLVKNLPAMQETLARFLGQKADLYSSHHVRIYKEMPVNQAEGTQQSLIMTLDC